MKKTVKTFEISENILRVVCTPQDEVKPPFLVQEQPPFNGVCMVGCSKPEETCQLIGNGEDLLIQKGFTFTPKEVYQYTFEGEEPIIVTKKTVDGERSFVENAKTIKIGDAYEAKIQFQIEPDEAIYGLGQHEDGTYNYRNVTEYLYHNNMKIPMPVFLSSKQYAILFDCTSMMVYEERDNLITITLDAVDQIDYYIIYGQSLENLLAGQREQGKCFDELIAGIRTLTGTAVMLPRWAFGYIQSKERYKTQEEILETAAEFGKRKIPLGCLVLDWMSWEEGKWGNKIFDKSRFPDAKAMVDQLHKDGVAFMISIWPNCREGCENNEEFAKKGKLLCNYSTYDAFDEEAREMYWHQCEQELFAAGTDAWWCDSTEPFTPDWNGSEKRPGEIRYQMAKESTNKYLDARTSNAYPLMHARGIYEHQRSTCQTKRVCNLTRSGYPGTQRYGTILWSGDIAATWQVYRNQIAEGLSMAMSGIPYWTWDAGAFFVGNTESWKRWANVTEGTRPWFWHGDFEEGVKDKGYCELYTRWLQLSAFLPIMRSHGTDTPREPWQFGEEGSPYYDSIVKYIRLRYQLLPYTYSLAAQVMTQSYTIMRSLMFDFANDEKVKEIKDEFMFGTAFLVAPVIEPYEYGPGSKPLNKEPKREVYLPQGSHWYDYETHQWYEGGQTITKIATIDTIPVYVREGAIIPIDSTIGNTTGNVDTLEIYEGNQGMFVLYLDNGTDYSYENKNQEISYEEGACEFIPIVWNDEKKALIIGKTLGTYPVPPLCNARLIKKDGSITEQALNYTGEEIILEFKN
ncbi:MAG: glycoside hydrolase [Lachnospiraceae bacterium]|nr:glycoside hydrolase [Lachnospiraceae bacterium]